MTTNQISLVQQLQRLREAEIGGVNGIKNGVNGDDEWMN
jgi:hypothetical protein